MENIDFFKKDDLLDGSKAFFEKLNVNIDYLGDLPFKPENIFESVNFKPESNRAHELVEKVYTLGKISDQSLQRKEQEELDVKQLGDEDYDFILVLAIELKSDSQPKRGQLAELTRLSNKLFNKSLKGIPVMVIFRYGDQIALANTERIQYQQEWRDGEKIGKVALLRDVNIKNTHSGHLQILKNLVITTKGKKKIDTFITLYTYWQEVFSVSLLNKKFYQELSNWYFWAIDHVTFPNKPKIEDVIDKFGVNDPQKLKELEREHNATNVIRLLTRLLFTWFIKEKKLIPEELFDIESLQKDILKKISPLREGGLFEEANLDSIYYKSILQNLFFATLNCPIEADQFDKRARAFRIEGTNRGVDYLMRYKDHFKDPNAFLEKLNSIVPFLNGGLFECLDDKDENIFIDGFSDNLPKGEQLIVPDYLFFGIAEKADLSDVVGSTNNNFKKAAVKGLINILKSYKFTITENTPIEEDVALDPELLGKVFENLLASYNPETKKTARKQTGSFYTPREIVNYMVDESLIAYLKNAIADWGELDDETLDKQLHALTSFDSKDPFADNSELKHEIIRALSKCAILDPACGSGAFPMGILQKMVHILQKLDPENTIWRRVQEGKAKNEADKAFDIDDKQVRDERLSEISEAFDNSINDPNYARKLFLIENCIYGVDIQAIAVQISKLRFFISLVVEQNPNNDPSNNFNIRPLPNLETKFVAANTLHGLEKHDGLFDLEEISDLEQELKIVRHKIFSLKSKERKTLWRAKDKEIRQKISSVLSENGWPAETADKLANWDPYNQNSPSPFYNSEWMFGIKDGFDLVIGNPPYVQCPKGVFSTELFPYSEGKDKGKQNLYKVFVENSYNLLKPRGVATMIVQSSLMCDISAQYTRELLLTKTIINHIIEFPKKAKTNEGQVFENVLQGTCVYSFIKSSPNENTTFNVSIDNDITTINSLEFEKLKQYELSIIYPNGFFIPLVNKGEFNLIKHLNKESKFLIELIRDISQGDLNLTVDKNSFSTVISDIPLLRGKHTHKYIINYNSEEFVLNNFKLNIAKDYLTNEYLVCQQITGTTDKFRIHIALTENKKVLFGNSVNKFLLKDKKYNQIILGLLNSKLMDWYFRKTSTNNHVNGYEIEQLPIKTPQNQALFITLVEKIIEGKKSEEDTSALEHQIDVMVYHLYGLSYEEACVIDPALLEGDFEKYKL